MGGTLGIIWSVSMLVEFGALLAALRSSWRKMYPRFLAYLAFDLSASLILFWLASSNPHIHNNPWLYDWPWRITQALLGIGRFIMVMESYQKLASTQKRWSFSDGYSFPLSAAGTMIFHAAMVRPLHWPASYLEAVWESIGASNCLMGMVMVCILFAAHRHNLIGTTPHSHARILCGYLLVTSPCYYLAAQSSQYIGIVLMSVATICYSSWIYLALRSFQEPEAQGAHVG